VTPRISSVTERVIPDSPVSGDGKFAKVTLTVWERLSVSVSFGPRFDVIKLSSSGTGVASWDW